MPWWTLKSRLMIFVMQTQLWYLKLWCFLYFVRLGYCFTPYQRLWLYNGAPLVAFYDTLGIRRTYSRLKPPASSRGLYFVNEKFNKNAKVEKLTKKLGRGVCLIVKGPLYWLSLVVRTQSKRELQNEKFLSTVGFNPTPFCMLVRRDNHWFDGTCRQLKVNMLHYYIVLTIKNNLQWSIAIRI